jgi:hypothetical protein
MLYLHRLLHMSTFLRMALTATLALSASLSLVRSESVRAEVSKSADDSNALQVEKTLGFAHRSKSQFVAEPLYATFDPEPNDPPSRTGGSGTR